MVPIRSGPTTGVLLVLQIAIPVLKLTDVLSVPTVTSESLPPTKPWVVTDLRLNKLMLILPPRFLQLVLTLSPTPPLLIV